MVGAVNFPVFRQLDQMDCGPTCIKIISKFFGKEYHLDYLREISFLQKGGVSMEGLSAALDQLGFDTVVIKANFREINEIPLPAIAHWEGNHFLVIYKVNRKYIYVSDPAQGSLKYTHKEFLEKWGDTASMEGIVLLVEPTEKFFCEESVNRVVESGIGFLVTYLRPHYKYINQVLLGLFVVTVIQLLLPFLTQSIVDFGINFENVSFIYLIVVAQLFLFLTRAASEVIRDWILLYISTRVNIDMISDFLEKLLILPIKYFDSKTTGDFIQRIYDHQRVDEFLAGRALTIPFDILNLCVMGMVLSYFNLTITWIYIAGTFLFFGWALLFMKKKEILDHKLFDLNREEQSLFLQMIQGVTEIKLNNSELRRKNEWQINQNKLFGLQTQILKVNQAQMNGGRFINELTNILIVFWSARLVISGDITLGTMLAIQFIIGSLAIPISNSIEFIVGYQRAILSLNRLSEVHLQKPEKQNRNKKVIEPSEIKITNLFFKYAAISKISNLSNINVIFPKGKITAIVGASGSGKTTLLKLLLKLYDPQRGSIEVGSDEFEDIDPENWRRHCGVVMQDGILFNDTIERNITESQSHLPVKTKLLRRAVQMVNLTEMIENLPLGLQTRIGEQGQLLSGGEKQRLLIARAIYKNPSFIFLDEATSSLDSENEKIISQNFGQFFHNRTVVLIAHRLSTVINAHQILVMNRGEIVERGNHEELVAKQGLYHNLIKSQLKF